MPKIIIKNSKDIQINLIEFLKSICHELPKDKEERQLIGLKYIPDLDMFELYNG